MTILCNLRGWSLHYPTSLQCLGLLRQPLVSTTAPPITTPQAWHPFHSPLAVCLTWTQHHELCQPSHPQPLPRCNYQHQLLHQKTLNPIKLPIADPILDDDDDNSIIVPITTMTNKKPITVQISHIISQEALQASAFQHLLIQTPSFFSQNGKTYIHARS